MSKFFDLCEMIDALEIPESQKFNMRMAAASVENAGMIAGYKIGFTAGLKEGRELEAAEDWELEEAMKHLPHNIKK